MGACARELHELDEFIRVLELEGYYCWYCGTWDPCPQPRGGFIIEHMTPKSRGGSDDPGNLVVACRSCNSLKSYRTVEEYRSLLANRRGCAETLFFGETRFYAALMEQMQKVNMQPWSYLNLPEEWLTSP